MNNNLFEAGEFLTSGTSKNFVIFDGKDISLSPSYHRFTVICHYDPSKYTNDGSGVYKTAPFLEISTKYKKCEKAVDTDKPNYWWRRCTDTEIQDALKTLESYGYYWDFSSKSLVDIESGEIVAQIRTAKLKYCDEEIKHVTEGNKKVLKGFVDSKSTASTSYGGYNSNYYSQYWDD